MKTTVEYNNNMFTIDKQDLSISLDGQEIMPSFSKKLKRWYIFFKDQDGNMHSVPRARLICQAFHPNPNYMDLFTDHIDSNPANDNPSNLRWVTRKENNSTRHAKAMKKKNAKHTTHMHEVIKATHKYRDEVAYFANGKHCAKAIGCTTALVYAVLRKENKKRTAMGWYLEWTSSDCDVAATKDKWYAERLSSKREVAEKKLASINNTIKYLQLRNEAREACLSMMSSTNPRAAGTLRKLENARKRVNMLESKRDKLEQMLEASN